MTTPVLPRTARRQQQEQGIPGRRPQESSYGRQVGFDNRLGWTRPD